MSPIKDFNLTYEALNEEITFSAGDTIVGTATLNLSKDIKIKSFLIKAKGDANVHWSKGNGDDDVTYSAHRRYFKMEEYLVAENDKGTVLPKGFHQFKFKFQIPKGNLPSSFKGRHGSITYMLEAKISRSWRLPSKTQKEINFVSKTFLHVNQVMCPQAGSVIKEIGTFSKAQIQLFATASKKVCSPGDTLSVDAKISNSSSKNVKPKFKLVQRTVYRASGSTNSSEKILAKAVGDTVEPSSEKRVSCQLMVPADAIHTIHNCEIIMVEYYIKVSADVSFAFDPKVVFPLAVVPSGPGAMHVGEAARPYPHRAIGAQSYTDFPPLSYPAGLPSANEYPPPYPPPSANIGSGYSNQWPQNLASSGFSAEAPMPSLEQPPAITVPTQFQQDEEPPSYMTLYPPSYDTLCSGSEHKS